MRQGWLPDLGDQAIEFIENDGEYRVVARCQPAFRRVLGAVSWRRVHNPLYQKGSTASQFSKQLSSCGGG
jgi:hypothetical protein